MLQPFYDLLGTGGVLTEADALSRYTVDYRKLMLGETKAVLRPRSVDDVRSIVRLAGELGFGLVPQGGNTSYVGGATPEFVRRQLVVSLERMTSIRSVDASNFCMTCDAGVILSNAQAAAKEHGLLLPLSLGSEGTCRLGGNIGTNAGGVQVLRYGMTRDLILGIEAVLPDGELFSDMRGLRKNNIGYDVKQIFIGAEGTLGIVTGVVLKLWPAQSYKATAWIDLSAGVSLAEIAAYVRRETSDLASSFEFMSATSVGLVAAARQSESRFPSGANGSLLLELTTSSSLLSIDNLLISTLEHIVEAGWADDAVVAQSEAQRGQMWSVREAIPEAEVLAGGSVKHDISVPISRLEEFVDRAGTICAHTIPEARVSFYGHVGDGNIHYNLVVPKGRDRIEFTRAVEASLARELYDLAVALGGSFSAEYGIGRFKRDLLVEYADPVRVSLLRKLKTGIDPHGLMNVGAMLNE